MDKKASGKALLPFGIFVGVYLATGMILNFQGVEMAFYQLPAPVAAILGILVAFAMFSGKMDEKLGTFLTGCGSEGIMTMCMIYLFAGAFATVSNAMGGVDSVVNLGMSVMPPQFIAAGAFVISAFIALATGTSVGYCDSYDTDYHWLGGGWRNQYLFGGGSYHWRSDVRRQSFDDFGYDHRSNPHARR